MPLPLLHWSHIHLPQARLVAACSEEGLGFLHFENQRTTEYLQAFALENGFDLHASSHKHLEQTEMQLRNFFGGRLKEFTIPLDLRGKPFPLSVWNYLLSIPYGKTITYKQQAEDMQQPLAIRAIAHANGLNPICIIVPCHRVVGSNGKLQGYSGGIENKRLLLELERQNEPVVGQLF